MTKSEIVELLQLIESDEKVGRRMAIRPIYRTLYYSGRRRSEALPLKRRRFCHEEVYALPR